MEFIWLSRWQPQLLAILRIVTGLLFLEHGLSKLFAFPVPFPVHPLPTLLLAAAAIEMCRGLPRHHRAVHAARRFHRFGRNGRGLLDAALPEESVADCQHG